MSDRLPIDEALPALIEALSGAGRAVLQAPPGAGKTTRVPLALLEAGLFDGRLVMLEPRRIAARAAAERMAQTLGEPLGRRVGYRIRGESRVSGETRIEVVTEGILTRMIQSDPGLSGIGMLVFDEFHERSLNADLGLALAWEVRGALREDLKLLVMSATLDAAPVAALLEDAPVVTSQGRSFAVETRWLDAPLPRERRFDAAAAALVETALADSAGGVLVFLPGEGEIRRVAARLEARLPAGTVLRPLYGALPLAAQRAAIRAEPGLRKVVLATAIAETSLTIEDVRVVVDTGRARRARFDPGSGMSRLVTERVSRAEAEQRRGRAGRVAPGLCYRMWTRGEEGGLPPFAPAEIEAADLTGLALELALWGARDPGDLAFLTPPNPGAWAEARALLAGLGALEPGGGITAHGRRLAGLALHPRLAHMLAVAGPGAADLAALLGERDPMRGVSCDLSLRLAALRRGDPRADSPTLERIRTDARRLLKAASDTGAQGLNPAQMAALAYPDRIGLRRPSDDPRWVLSGGRGAVMEPGDPMAGARLIVATDLDGGGREARIRQAIEITERDLREVHGDRIAWHDTCLWSRRDRRVLARQQERLGALVLADRIWREAPPAAVAQAMLEGVRDLGLPWSAAARRLQARIEVLRAEGTDLPDCADAALSDALQDWLLPHLSGVTDAAGLRALDLCVPLQARLGRDGMALLDRLAPAHFTTPLGRKLAIDYSGEAPQIEVRLQEMFGLTRHPTIGQTRRPLRITLLSPAGRPVQTTMNLPGFWATSYTDVRKDMRGRYPRHPWPEDPTAADPTLRAKPRS